ncbi:hypothetical protein [Flavobacterium psychrotrophum]|uniref:hypothetical protein n=1 Tax=Flavobacterium psychrotrophum TaxID=2294119 RepID=UPI000E3100E7|nr:hypothetical protein [Flavobacterium psychrotrophum]
MKLNLFLCALIFVTLSSCEKKEKYPYEPSDFRSEVNMTLKKLSKEKQLPVNDTIATNYLEKVCTKDELQKIILSKKPILRIIGYRALINRKDEKFFDILIRHLNDTAKVTWWYYDDAGGLFTISDLMIRKAQHILTQKQKNILIDSVLLKHPYLEVSDWMIQEINPNERYYSVIKSKCSVKTDRCGTQLGACYALSKFKKEQDLPFLHDIFNNLEEPCGYWVFRAIEINPQEVFFPILEKYFKENIKKKKQQSYNVLEYYCRSVASYRSGKSLKLLESLLDKSNYPDKWYFNDNEDYVFKAIHKYKAPIYDKLYNDLKPKMDDHIMKYLNRINYNEKTTWK